MNICTEEARERAKKSDSNQESEKGNDVRDDVTDNKPTSAAAGTKDDEQMIEVKSSNLEGLQYYYNTQCVQKSKTFLAYL